MNSKDKDRLITKLKREIPILSWKQEEVIIRVIHNFKIEKE